MAHARTGLDLDAIQTEMAAAPPHSPLPEEAALAIINDCFRAAGMEPLSDAAVEIWRKGFGKLTAEQAGIMAHYLASTSLREATVRAIGESEEDLRPGLIEFFLRIAPLTAEMIRSNSFRREEALRRWAEWLSVPIAGEKPKQSAARLEKIDYRKTLSEYRKAEEARKREEADRARILKEAEEKEAAARGWRE